MLYSAVRSSFLSFFEKQGHKLLKSGPIIPQDPTLLFTNAGMVQFKDIFLGLDKASYNSATTSQKCLRISGKHNDLEQVGFTKRHHTFFEMLGNFSFGRYFKEEAIAYAWNFLVGELKIDPKRLYITVFAEDDDAAKIWKKVSGKDVIKISTNDNFWSMGENGPCGPCSEIYYDHGDKYYGSLPSDNADTGDRYVEIWNLVFMQYNQIAGSREPLAVPCIDTGMGLERISAVMQGVCSNFDIDIFKNLILSAAEVLGNKDLESPSYKIIADHMRASAFLISEGVLPSNEGRGYVLRRIIRRAVRHIDKLCQSDDPMFFLLFDGLVEQMGDSYKELRTMGSLIRETLRLEEEKFKESLKTGLKILNNELTSVGLVSGEVAFKLYDTYGFPLDLTQIIAKEQSKQVDVGTFEDFLSEQRKNSKKGWKGSGDTVNEKIFYKIKETVPDTVFTGYDSCVGNDCKVLAIVRADELVDKVSAASQNRNSDCMNSDCILILDKTPFYAESGGQVADTGEISSNDFSFRTRDVKKIFGSIFLHYGCVTNGVCSVGQLASASVNKSSRQSITENHSAVHLLHKALKKMIGNHVMQKGSYVSDSKFHFDFNYDKSLSLSEISDVEDIVNCAIMAKLDVTTNIMNKDKAIESGAVALFEEKYSDSVRVVSMGDFSSELCGGTHVNNTGEILVCKIIREYSVGSGIRRIEGVAGAHALKYLGDCMKTLQNISAVCTCQISEVESKVVATLSRIKDLEKKSAQYAIREVANSFMKKQCTGYDLYYCEIADMEIKDARCVLDQALGRYKTGAFLVLIKALPKVTALLSVSGDMLHIVNANDYIKKIANVISGHGGGKKDFAQCGGNIYKNINEILSIFL